MRILRHYVFLNQGLPDIEADLAERNISFVMRRAPHESHERFLADVHAAFLIGDENPMREPERWRKASCLAHPRFRSGRWMRMLWFRRS